MTTKNQQLHVHVYLSQCDSYRIHSYLSSDSGEGAHCAPCGRVLCTQLPAMSTKRSVFIIQCILHVLYNCIHEVLTIPLLWAIDTPTIKQTLFAITTNMHDYITDKHRAYAIPDLT